MVYKPALLTGASRARDHAFCTHNQEKHCGLSCMDSQSVEDDLPVKHVLPDISDVPNLSYRITLRHLRLDA